MRVSQFFSTFTAALFSFGRTQAKHVFSHYMVGTVTEAHAQKDIDDARAMGLDGFALNIGDATKPFVKDALKYLFSYAESLSDFKLYVSMDVYASGAACYAGNHCATCSCNGPYDYQWVWDAHKISSAYFHYSDLPLISTFSSGGFNNTEWKAWKDGLANDMYFWPDLDETTGYYDNADGWWYYWGDLCEGLFSWESAWPLRAGFGGLYPGDVSPDLTVIKGTQSHDKTYMMGLSALQYKNSYGANVYRQGDETLPARMINILSMADLGSSPDIVQVITWNDGPESHYIGNLWIEQNNDTQPWAYANQVDWDHTGWQPLITSFIAAYKNGAQESDMAPPNGQVAVGAMWYKSILTDSIVCGNPDDGNTADYYSPPSGFLNGTNSLYWSIVLDPTAASGYKVDLYTGGSLVYTQVLSGGLNHGWTPDTIAVGDQELRLKNPDGDVIMTASGGLCVQDGCPDGIYNSNYQVRPLVTGTTVTGCTIDRTGETGDTEYQMCDPDDDLSARPECVEGTPLCDLTLTFASMADLDAANEPSYCQDIYALQVVQDMLTTSLANYSNVDNDYDTKFKYYVEYVKDMVPTALAEFMNSENGPGNQFFDCTWNQDGKNTTTRQCPFDQSSLAEADYTVYFTLVNATGFWDLLESTYGIIESWVQFGDSTFDPCHTASTTCTVVDQKYVGWPLAADSITVPNPKDIVTSALAKMPTLKLNILSTLVDILMGTWNGPNDDVVQAVSTPVFMIAQAVQSMSQVKAIGTTVEEDDKKNLILEILGGVLFFVPFLGEAADIATGLADLARIANLIGEASNAALSVIGVINDPTSAPMAIIGTMLGASDFRNPKGYSDMASLRRGMTDDVISDLGDVFKESDDDLQKVVRACSGK